MRAAPPAVRTFLHGNVRRLSSFSIINRHLIRGLRRRGHRLSVFPSDDPSAARTNPPPPDLYIFHGHPWEARSAPGRINVFALNYEYLAPDRAVRALVARLNAAFDLVVVPSAFTKPVLASAGLKVPIEVIPWGYDPAEFHPGARPVALSTARSFVFLYVGAVNERKGVDALLRAYLAEFSAADDVVLVIKESFRHPTWAKWAAELQRRHLGDRRGARPEVLWIDAESPTVAGYFAAADVGVFPHRGEGFGLPILECIASGRRVIVTAGAGPAAFCSDRNSWQIRARRARRLGRLGLEPDVRHLRSLLRTAYARGTVPARHRVAVSRTARAWTWRRSVLALDAVTRRYLEAAEVSGVRSSRPLRERSRRRPEAHGSGSAQLGGAAGARPRRTTAPASAARAPVVAYAFHSRGTTSWKKICTEFDRALGARFDAYGSFTRCDRFDLPDVDIVVGHSEHCLEVLLKVRRQNPRAIVIAHQECTVLGDRLAIVNRERKCCGLAPIAISPMEFWQNRIENDLANRFIVASSVAREFFLANGFAASGIHVIPFGMRGGAFHFRGGAAKTRFLFLGTDPFRKGIRSLLAAWDRAALRDAELICFTNLEVLGSRPLLRYLVRNPSITVRPLPGQREFMREYANVDCQVLPSLEDTFSLAVGDGMGVGKPAIVSTATGIRDLIVHGVNGHVVPAGNVDRLAESLQHFAADRRRLRTMGEAAYETAREFTWRRFRRSVGELVESIWADGR